jgi:hypothetical protein
MRTSTAAIITQSNSRLDHKVLVCMLHAVVLFSLDFQLGTDGRHSLLRRRRDNDFRCHNLTSGIQKAI